jgi:hypothetical protein
VRLLEHRQENVLGRFLGVALVLQDRHREAEDLPVEPFKQRFDRLGRSFPKFLQKNVVIEQPLCGHSLLQKLDSTPDHGIRIFALK